MVFVSPYRNVYENLAFEDLLFSSYSGVGLHLLLYVNDPCVVMGRFQNPWQEMNLPRLYKTGVLPARRVSGGGTVYHDNGNLNFSVFSPRDGFSRAFAVGIARKVLAKENVLTETNGRHDILIDGNKISGSAYRIVKHKAYHHGTLLINAKLENVSSLLCPTYNGIDAVGVDSVRSPVTNISGKYTSTSVQKIIDRFSEDPAFLENQSLLVPDSASVKLRAASLADPGWIFGKTPAFSIHCDGNVYKYPKGQLPTDDRYSLPFICNK